MSASAEEISQNLLSSQVNTINCSSKVSAIGFEDDNGTSMEKYLKGKECQYIEIQDLLEEFRDMFAEKGKPLKATSLVKHRSDTEDNPPVYKPPYRIPLKLQQVVRKKKVDVLQGDIRVTHLKNVCCTETSILSKPTCFRNIISTKCELTVVTSFRQANCSSSTFSTKNGDTPIEDAWSTEVSVLVSISSSKDSFSNTGTNFFSTFRNFGFSTTGSGTCSSLTTLLLLFPITNALKLSVGRSSEGASGLEFSGGVSGLDSSGGATGLDFSGCASGLDFSGGASGLDFSGGASRLESSRGSTGCECSRGATG
ncbi:unnamed protein product [Acanthoscelides obtectus]|uniref:Uncharacterized protein n=1 Tax=Acanthoscelides obtectus TaxID=200917 RepID=A0A9P0JUF2_ACAOB|nr:unnamed protein product [Acanthoscelides obtectus]CAK1627911.1 hypothetical protein AOBTE_LOCUS4897 [Acanthoscelides obtectus]